MMYAIIAWYSRARSSLRRAISCSRVTVESAICRSFCCEVASCPGEPQLRVSSRAIFLQMQSHMRSRLIASFASLVLAAAVVTGQTPITPPSNDYTPEQDVQLGLDAARQAREQLPIMRDEIVSSYVNGVGRRLVDAIPAN